MCQTAVISNNIVKLGIRTYKHRIKSSGERNLETRKLTCLNHDLDNLYNVLYNEVNTIKAEDYEIFGPQLEILIQSVADLYNTLQSFGGDSDISIHQIQRLYDNYSSLFELNSDIKNFRVSTKNINELKSILKEIGN